MSSERVSPEPLSSGVAASEGWLPLVIRAPGRVNLIGGHVDFHDGPVVTAAIDRFIDLDLMNVGGYLVTLNSEGYDGEVHLAANGGDDPSAVEPPWGRLVAAVLRALDAKGRPPVGFNARLRSSLPAGGGLSSSAAFELVVALAALRAADGHLPMGELALAAEAAEAEATGVECGIQDQMAVLAGGVSLIDCRDLTVEPLELPSGASLLVVDSRVHRTLEGSPWVKRRTTSFEQAATVGVAKLRDATAASVQDLPQARHVVEEIQRVGEFAGALRAGDARTAGQLMVASHESSRDLWNSSTPELNGLVRWLVDAGAHGARLTGGGFGGCVVALVPSARAGHIAQGVLDRFQDRFGHEAVAHHATPVPGAGPL